MMQNGVMDCSVCHSKLMSPNARAVSRAYDKHRSNVSSKNRALNVLLVVGDCILVGLQVIDAFDLFVELGRLKFEISMSVLNMMFCLLPM